MSKCRAGYRDGNTRPINAKEPAMISEVTVMPPRSIMLARGRSAGGFPSLCVRFDGGEVSAKDNEKAFE